MISSGCVSRRLGGLVHLEITPPSNFHQLRDTTGAIAVKAVYGKLTEDSVAGSLDQYSVSATYTADALAVTAFGRKDFADQDIFGVGASYDLGGGASVVGGYVNNTTTDDSAFDLGLSFSF